MKTRQELQSVITEAKVNLKSAVDALAKFDSAAENNVFESKERAEFATEDMCDKRAHEDCEGAGNRGLGTYTQDYMVDGVKYRCTATYEYNRHDKTYYYIDGRDYKHEALA